MIKRRLLLKSLVVLGAAACSPAPAASPTAATAKPTEAPKPAATTAPAAAGVPAAAPAATTASVAAKPGAPEAAWQTILDAGRKEGKVLIYGTLLGADDATKVGTQFKQDTGIDLDFLSLLGGAATTRIREELKVNRGPDIFEASGGWVGAMALDGVFLPLKDQPLPVWGEPQSVWHAHPGYKSSNWEQVLSRLRPKNGHITVNTKLLTPGDYPTSWKDLATNPKFKGKLTWSDPAATTGSSVLWSMLGYTAKDLTIEDFWGLAQGQDTLLFQQSRGQFMSVAQGERAICVAGADESVLDLITAGAPIKNVYFPNTANYAQSADMAVLKAAPRKNAALVFVNWYLSKAGQESISTIQKVASFRKDVSNQVPEQLRGEVIGGGKLRATLMESPGQSKFASDLQQSGIYKQLPEGGSSKAFVAGYEAFTKDWESKNGGPQDKPLEYSS